MTGSPIDLDAYRRRGIQGVVVFRPHVAEYCDCDARSATFANDPALHAQLLAGPAETWIEVCRKLTFLIDAHARTLQVQDPQIQILVRRALGDVARLTRCEARTP